MQQHIKLWEVAMIASAVAAWLGLGVTPAAAKRALVEVTGQTQCWDVDGVSIPCADTGHDADVPWGVPFPQTLRFDDKGNGTVQDTLTGLIWLKAAACFPPLYWDEALAAVADLNKGMIACWEYTGTFTDWRLPNVKELQSLIHFGFSDPALSNAAGTDKCTATDCAFVGVQATFFYWSSTTRVDRPCRAWGVDLADGNTIALGKGGDIPPCCEEALRPPNCDCSCNPVRRYVWPVRGGHVLEGQ